MLFPDFPKTFIWLTMGKRNPSPPTPIILACSVLASYPCGILIILNVSAPKSYLFLMVIPRGLLTCYSFLFQILKLRYSSMVH